MRWFRWYMIQPSSSVHTACWRVPRQFMGANIARRALRLSLRSASDNIAWIWQSGRPSLTRKSCCSKESALVEQPPDMHSFAGFRPELPYCFVVIPIFFQEDTNDPFGELFVIHLEEVEATCAGEFTSCKPLQGFEPWFEVGKVPCGK